MDQPTTPEPTSPEPTDEAPIVGTYLVRVTLREPLPDQPVAMYKAPTIDNLENAMKTSLWASFGLDANVSAERTDI
jgi:hypothetical protein